MLIKLSHRAATNTSKKTFDNHTEKHCPPYDPNFNIFTATKWSPMIACERYGKLNYHYILACYLKQFPNKEQHPHDICRNCYSKKMLGKWNKFMNYDVPIKICAPCGSQIVMSDKEYSTLSFKNKYFNCCKVKTTDELPAKNSIKYKALHLYSIKNSQTEEIEIYKFASQCIENNKVIVCPTCMNSLKTAAETQVPPKHTFAHYDIGKIPSHLPDLTLGEKLSLSKIIIFIPEIQLKGVSGLHNKGVKGHCLAQNCRTRYY